MLVDRLVVSAEARTRMVDAIETAYRESGEVIFEIRSAARASQADNAPLRAAVRMQGLQPALRGTGATPVLLQQSLRRLPALPGLRQHDRLRSRPRDSRQDQDAGRRRDRALDQAEVSSAVYRSEALCQAGGHSARCARGRISRTRTPRPGARAARENFWECADSSIIWSARNTSCTCACF